MTKYLITLVVFLTGLSPQAHAYRDLETGTFPANAAKPRLFLTNLIF